MIPAEVSPALALAHLSGTTWLDTLSAEELAILPYVFDVWLRPEQRLPRHHWRTCGLSGGRGWGKGLAVASEINRRVEAGGERHILLMAPTEDRVKDVQFRPLIETAPPWFVPEIYHGGLRWPNGVRALAFTPEAPGRTRGENASLSWCTELVDWKHTTRLDAWDNIATATRIGRAQIIWDSTSKGRNDLLGALHAACDRDPEQHVRIEGTMFDNVLLSLQYMRAEYERYTGVRRQEELFGERFDEAAGASFKQAWLDRDRCAAAPDDLEWEIISIDPALSTIAQADETGLCRAARARRDGHVYVLEDGTGKHAPEAWGDWTVSRCKRGGRVSIERNHLGDAGAAVLRSRASNAGLLLKVIGRDDPWPPLDPRCIHVREQVSRESKGTRADGPAAEAEAGRVHLVGEFPDLERELTTYVSGSGRSPNRFDAFVYAVTELRELTRETRADRTQDIRTAAAVQTKLMGALAGRGGRRLGL